MHVLINFLSVINPDSFNTMAHFMGTNPIVQFAMQPILVIFVVFHFVMGFVLEIKNRKSRGVSYAVNNPGSNSTWVSRNMIITGALILTFISLHFYDFWFPEVATKYIKGDWSGLHDGKLRYYHELVAKFANPVRVGLYVVGFFFLALHLMHGFQSAFQSIGLNHKKYTPFIKKLGTIYAILVPALFAFIAIFHYINHIIK